MIVRAIAKNPEIADNFDYFNDYKDTAAWLRVHVGLHPDDAIAAEAMRRLRNGFEAYETAIKGAK